MIVSRLRTLLLVALICALATLLVACGGGGADDADGAATGAEDSATSTDGTAAPTTSATESDAAAADDGVGRVVVLGEEFALADVLALGVEPVASTATVTSGFRGIERDTDDIEILSATDTDIERVAALEPDMIVLYPYLLDVIGEETLDQLGAELVVLPDTGFRDDVRTMAEAFGVPERAEELFADYDDAVAAAGEALPEGLSVSMVTVYAGENLAIWADGPVNVPATFQDAGIELTPGPDEVEGIDDNGRAFVSTEQLQLLDGDALVTLQTSAVEGEDAALAAIRETELWAAVPAVEQEHVVELDRLGYPGIEGRIRLAEQLPELLGDR